MRIVFRHRYKILSDPSPVGSHILCRKVEPMM